VGERLQAHVYAIDQCNQRGGRMLSLIDLLDAGTVDLPLAAYLAAAMRSGASLLVGAVPGGAGKTAVMCALLNFLPDHTSILPVDSPGVLDAGQAGEPIGEVCYLAHEIGAGPYYAYIWGAQARDFFRLAGLGHIVASNLHADTLEETQGQLCGQNGVDPEHLVAVTLKVYLRIVRTRGWALQRWVSQVYESDGLEDRLLWTGEGNGAFVRHAASAIVSPEQERAHAVSLAALLGRDIRHIGDVRRWLTDR